MIRILLGSSYFDDWTETEQPFVTEDPLGNPVDQRHPWNKVTIPKPQKRDFADKYSWVVSPRIYDKRTDTHVCCDTGGGPFARQWCTAKAGLVDFGYAKATGDEHPDGAAEDRRARPRWSSSGRSRRSRTRSSATAPATYHQAYSALIGLHCLERAFDGGPRRADQELEQLQGPRGGGQRRLPRGGARRALASHGDPRAARSPTTSPTRRRRGTRACATSTEPRAPTRTRCRTRRSSRRTGPENFKGVDIMRAVRSFDPCLPCGVHMYSGKGQVRKVVHTPTGHVLRRRAEHGDGRRSSAAGPARRPGGRRRPRRWSSGSRS